jgi:hypothetical protein
MTDPPVVRVSIGGGLVTRQGPSVLDCLEAAMRADPALTIEEAIRAVPISQGDVAPTAEAQFDADLARALAAERERERLRAELPPPKPDRDMNDWGGGGGA